MGISSGSPTPGSIVLVGIFTLLLGSAGHARAAQMLYEFETDVGYYGIFSWDPDSTFDGGGAGSGAETGVGYVWGPTGGNHLDVTLYDPVGSLVLNAQYTGADIWVWVDRIYCEDDVCQDHDFDALYFDLYSGPTTSVYTEIHFTDNTGLVFPYYQGDTGDPLPEFARNPIDLSDFTSATINGMSITAFNLIPEPSTTLLLALGLVGLAAERRRRAARFHQLRSSSKA